jgi:alpha-L-fucosidase 2
MNDLSKSLNWILFAIAAACSAAEISAAPIGDNSLVLWYDKPAVKWVEALPVGNGRLGAMVFGGVPQERLQLNEGTLWAGGPYNPVNPEAKEALPQVRQLINEGKYREAAQLISAKVMAKPLTQMPYQTVGDLLLSFPGTTNIQNYRRDLDLETATAMVSYTRDGVRYKREIFASAPDNVIVVRLTADKPGKIWFTAGMKTPMKATVEVNGNDTLVMRGKGGDSGGIKGALNYQAHIKIIAKGGKVTAGPDHFAVDAADEATLLITAATCYKNFDDVSGDPESIAKKQLTAAAKQSFSKLRATHLSDYQALFRRVTIDLGQSEAMKLPTDVRIRRFAER